MASRPLTLWIAFPCLYAPPGTGWGGIVLSHVPESGHGAPPFVQIEIGVVGHPPLGERFSVGSAGSTETNATADPSTSLRSAQDDTGWGGTVLSHFPESQPGAPTFVQIEIGDVGHPPPRMRHSG